MSVGGATFGTAGTLELGSGNDFDIADVTEVGTVRPYNHAWWSYTVPVRSTLVVDTFASVAVDLEAVDTLLWVYDGALFVGGNDDSSGGPPGTFGLSRATVILEAGVEYHILAGTFDSNPAGLITYRLTVSVTPNPLTPIAPSYSIPGRPTAPAGGTSGSPAVIGPNQVSAPTPRSSGGDAWWQITPDIDGRLSFDALLSFTTDNIRNVTYPRVHVWLYRDASALAVSGGGYDPELASFVPRGQVSWDLTAGVTYRIRLEVVSGWPAATAFLRVSDYAPNTGWLDSVDVQIITGRTTDGLTIPPNPVATVTDDEEYIQPFGTAYGFEGAAAITHYPQFEGDPGYGLHPWLFTSNWEAIWNRATQGKWTTASDWGPSAGVSNPIGFDGDGYWDNNRIFADWPVGYFAESSAIDGAPPDGHQEIAYTVWAFHWHIKVSRFLYDYPGGDSVIVPWVISEEPDDRPEGGETWDLQWDAELGDPPRLKAIEVGSNPAATGAIFAAGDPLDGFFWDVRGKTLSWEGDPDFQNGHWYQATDPDVPAPGTGHDIYRGPDIVDGAPDTETFPRHGYYGPGPIPTQGDSLASWQADSDDWHVVLDGEAAIAEYLAYEAPGLADEGHSARTDVGSLILSAIPAVLITAGIPDRGFLADARSHASFNVFASLRGTYARPRHRWVGTPIIPVVVPGSTTVTRQWPRDDGRGLSSGPRLFPPPKSRRLVGGHQ